MIFSGWTPFDVTPAGGMRTAAGERMGEGRPPGLHLGAIIHAAKVAAGEAVETPEGDQEGVRVQEGFLWETIVEYMSGGVPLDEAVQLAFRRYGYMVMPWLKQVRLERDGIHMTPDGVDPRVPELLSFKATRRTLRNARTQYDFEAHFWTWLMQEMGYCYAAGIPQVRWVVWWLAGDYSRGKGTGPEMLTAVARFEHEELVKNWEGVRAIAARLEA